MIKINPIPREMLPNQVYFYKYLGIVDGVDTWDEPVFLTFVAIHKNNGDKFNISSNTQDINCKAKMFYDVTNSRPLDITFTPKDRISYQGNVMTIVTVIEPFTASPTPHHYEIELV